MNLFEMMGIEDAVKDDNKKKVTGNKSTSGAKKEGSAVKNTTKVEDKKYTLPVTVYYLVEYSLTSEDFGGLEEVTEEQILNRLVDHYDLYMLSKKTALCDYLKDRNTIVIYTKSATKGGVYKALVDGNCHWCFDSDYMSFIGGKIYNGTLEGKFFDKLFLSLKYGKIPNSLYKNIVDKFREKLPNEYFAQIFLDKKTGSYFVDFPEQYTNRVTVFRKYGHLCYMNDIDKPLICEIHSHNYILPLNFSSIDDEDEINFKLYGIVGFDMDTSKVINKFRIGSNGTFRYVRFDEIFDCTGGNYNE